MNALTLYMVLIYLFVFGAVSSNWSKLKNEFNQETDGARFGCWTLAIIIGILSPILLPIIGGVILTEDDND